MRLNWAHKMICWGLLSFSSLTWTNDAPKGRAWPASWSSGTKQFYGTSFESYDINGKYSSSSLSAPISKLWFTGAQGIVSEVFWPTLDRKQIRDLQFLVSDDLGFFVEERTQTQSKVEWIAKGVPAFRVLTWDAAQNFEIEKLVYSDPSLNALIIKVKFRAKRLGLRLHVLLNPALGNTPYGDNAEVAQAPFQRLWAWQGDDALSLVSSLMFTKLSVGHSGSLDPFQEIYKSGRLATTYRRALNGNVVLAGEIPVLPEGETAFTLSLGFGTSTDRAHETALEALSRTDESLNLYQSQWKTYLNQIKAPKKMSLDQSQLYYSSVSILKSLEDKTFEGAFIASPSVPWGLNKIDNSRETSPKHTQMTRSELPESQRAKGIGAYHLVWPRDLYQMAESFIALGDLKTARASLSYLENIQYREGEGYWEYGKNKRFPKAGSFLQNSWLHGEAHWKMLQIDQTSYPVLLALKLHQLGEVSADEVKQLVFSASDFIEEFGPWTFQERWEENMGVAPSTLAVQIAALRGAAEFAFKNSENNRAFRYSQKAKEWDEYLERWTFTETGTKGNGKYFLRIVGTNTPLDVWNPNSNNWLPITNGAPPLLEKSVLDGGFLELVRLGVRKATDFFVRETIEEYDDDLRVLTPKGWGFFRYSGDHYNWDEATGQQSRGMIWPFLNAERARYEMIMAQETGHWQEATQRVKPYLNALEAFATPSKMLPEQVWDSGARAGLPTGAATPLGWAHGEYVRILLEYEDFQKTVQKPKASLQ